MASVSASDVNDVSDNQNYLSVNEVSADSNLNDNLVSAVDCDSIDSDSDLVAGSNVADDSVSQPSASDNPKSSDISSSNGSNNLADSEDSESTDSDTTDSDSPDTTTKNSTTITSSSTSVVKGTSYSVTLTDENGQALSGKSIIFTINGNNYTKTTNGDGIASIVINRKPMDYVVLVTFLGDDLYENSTLSETVTITKIPTTIKNYTSSPVKGKSYSVILKDKDGNPLASKAVTLTFNGKTYKKTTNDKGMVSITLTGNPGSTYKLTYKFAGDGNYLASSGSLKLKLKMATKIVGSDARIVKGSKFDVVLKNANNYLLANKKVTVLYNNKTLSRNTNSKGVLRLTLSPTPGKYYNITYKYAGTSFYGGCSKLLTVFIKTPTKFINSGSVICKGNTYHVTLKDSNGKALSNKAVTLTYASKSYKKTTNANGVVGLKISSGSPGTLKKFAYKFAGNSLYGASSGSVNLRTKLATKLTGSSSTIAKGNAYKVTLKDSAGKALSKAKVTMTFNGKSYNKTTNTKGVASLTINPSTLKTYGLSYAYAGSTKYNKSSGKVNLNVKMGTVIANQGSIAINNTTYMVSLKDSDSKAMVNKTITFKLDGKTYTNTTNENGVARLFIVESKQKTIPLTYKYSGDSQHVSASGSLNITVVSDKVFTFKQIVKAAKNLRSYVEDTAKVPATVTVNGVKVNLTSFTYLMCKAIVNVNNSKKSDVSVVPVKSNYTNGGNTSLNTKLYKSGYLSLCNYIINFVETKECIPNALTTNVGSISPNLYSFSYSKALDFYDTDGYLPNYITLNTNDVNGVAKNKKANASQYKKGLNEVQSLSASEIAKYLKSSGNDALNSAIKDLAKSLVSGKSTTWAKANAIFQYVRDNIDYQYYADTRYKATGTLSNKKGNCCDHANLIVALCRAANITARYSHAQGCSFSSGLYTGHVWAQIYVDGVWYSADATSKRNELGNIHNWNTKSFNTLKQYDHLPF